MKPDTPTAMRQLIAQIRASLPFDTPEAQRCSGPCAGCSMKLLNFMQTELDDWEQRLNAGETPGLADLSRLAKMGRKIYVVMVKNGLVSASH